MYCIAYYETDKLLSEQNNETYRKENTKIPQDEEILAFANYVIQFHKGNIYLGKTEDASSVEVTDFCQYYKTEHYVLYRLHKISYNLKLMAFYGNLL